MKLAIYADLTLTVSQCTRWLSLTRAVTGTVSVSRDQLQDALRNQHLDYRSQRSDVRWT